MGQNLTTLRHDAAFELFETYRPVGYAVAEKSDGDGLTFDVDRFLDSPAFFTEKIDLGAEEAPEP